MGVEKRKYPRRDIALNVYAEASDGSNIDCRLRDISRTGARLWTDDAGKLENDFLLVVSPKVRHQCRVVWRSGQEAGIIFLPKTPAVDRSSESKIAAADVQVPRLVMIKCPRTGRDISTGIRAHNANDLGRLSDVRRLTQCPHCKLAHGWTVAEARISAVS